MWVYCIDSLAYNLVGIEFENEFFNLVNTVINLEKGGNGLN